MRFVKLYIKDIKKMIDFKFYGAEVFKSGSKIKLWCRDKDYEDELVDALHKKNFLCIPDTVPTNGFYTLEYYLP